MDQLGVKMALSTVCTLLHVAVIANRLNATEYLLATGASLTLTDSDGNNAAKLVQDPTGVGAPMAALLEKEVGCEGARVLGYGVIGHSTIINPQPARSTVAVFANIAATTTTTATPPTYPPTRRHGVLVIQLMRRAL